LRASTRRARSFAVMFIGITSLSRGRLRLVAQVCTTDRASAPDYPVS
jgi:hypothetical protein